MIALPSVDDFGTYRGEAFAEGDETERAELFLQQALDFIWVLTGVENLSNARLRRTFQYATFETAMWLMAQSDHRDEVNSPFSSERIGSYSYQKMQQTMASSGGKTGIFWLDALLSLLLNEAGQGSGISVSSEHVFNPDEHTFEETLADERWERYVSGTYALYEH